MQSSQVTCPQKGEKDGEETGHAHHSCPLPAPSGCQTQIDQHQIDYPGDECRNDFGIALPSSDPILLGPNDTCQKAQGHKAEAGNQKLVKQIIQKHQRRQPVIKGLRFFAFQLSFLKEIKEAGDEGDKKHSISQKKADGMQVDPGTAENLRNRGRFDENRSQHQNGDQREQEKSKRLNSITQMGDKKAKRNRPGEERQCLSQVGQREVRLVHRSVNEEILILVIYYLISINKIFL